MAGDNRTTTSHNIDMLLENGFRQYRNTSIFSNKGHSMLSPAVSSGQGGHYWFDIRKVNLDKVNASSNPSILVRIIPNMFIWIKLDDFSFMLSEGTKRERKNSGEVWGFYISLNLTSKSGKIISTADSSLVHSSLILDKSSALKLLQ